MRWDKCVPNNFVLSNSCFKSKKPLSERYMIMSFGINMQLGKVKPLDYPDFRGKN